MNDEGNGLSTGSDMERGEAMSIAEHVSRWQGSGMSKRQYAQAYGLSYWGLRRACRRYAPESLRRTEARDSGKPAAAAPEMIEIGLRRCAEDALEIVLANGARVNLRGSHAHLLMQRLLSTLS